MKKKVFVVAAALAFSAFQGWSKENYKQEQFVNLLNIEVGYEAAPRGYFFSDLGGWHGYGFNSSADLAKAGGFRGPAFMGERSLGLQWLSDGFEKLTLKDDRGKILPFTKISAYEYLPGMLRQRLEAGDLKVEMKEIALTDRSTMIEYTVTNRGTAERTIISLLSGTATYKDACLAQESVNTLSVSVVGGKHSFVVSFPEGWTLKSDGQKEYEAIKGAQTLAPGKSYTFHTFTSYCPATDKESALAVHADLNVKGAKKYFKQNAKRW